MKIRYTYLSLLTLSWIFPLSTYSQSDTSSEDVFVFHTIGIFQGVRDDQDLRVSGGNPLYEVLENIRHNDIQPVSPLLLGVKINKEHENIRGVPVRHLSKRYYSYYLGDSSEIEVLALGINGSNIADFRYRVVENDHKEIVPWSELPGLEQAYGAKSPYAMIGRLQSPGKQLLIEVKHVDDYSMRDGVILDWRPPDRPQLQQIAVFHRDSGRTHYAGLTTTGLYESIDSRSQIPVGFRFKQNQLSNIQLFVEDHSDIPYSAFIRQLSAEDPIMYPVALDFFDKTFQIHEQHFSVPGSYELIINRSAGYGELPVNDALRIPFEVLPGNKMRPALTIEMVIVLSFFLTIVMVTAFVMYNRRQKRKLKQIALENEMAAFELKLLRNQLNPHFMFNALSSIQNLISKGLAEKANYYIGKFSLMTRQLLTSSNEEMVGLEEEMELIRNYLVMEQLRFDFRFKVGAEEGLEVDNIEIPAMLLQPLVENAVKHGVSALMNKGVVAVKISVDGHHLVVEIDDNGRGFEEGVSGGYGLGLTRQRIGLLNLLHADQTISLTFSRLNPGTRATLTFENWML